MTSDTKFEPSNVNVRIKISALWTAMLLVFAYVDILSLYRPDFRADVEAGEIGGFTVNQSFLLGTTVYVVTPSLMVFGALVLRPRVNRIANMALAIIYALTIHRRGDRRVELLHPRQRHPGRTAGGRRLLRVDQPHEQLHRRGSGCSAAPPGPACADALRARCPRPDSTSYTRSHLSAVRSLYSAVAGERRHVLPQADPLRHDRRCRPMSTPGRSIRPQAVRLSGTLVGVQSTDKSAVALSVSVTGLSWLPTGRAAR
jgi:Family of unknown function (DUF6326)